MTKLVKIGIGIIIFFLVVGFAINMMPFFTVTYGSVAIVTRFGKIVRVASPGLNFKIPFIEGVENFSVQKIIYETSEHTDQSQADYKDEPVDSSTQDGQQVSIRYTIRFRMPSDKIKSIAEQ